MRRSWLFLLLALCTCAGLFLLVYPMTVIQPFKRQDPGDLQRALFIFRIAPNLALALAAGAAGATILLWKRSRIFARIVCSVMLLLACVAAGLTRVNVFEQMFHPAGAPRFVSVKDTKTDPDDMLIAVAIQGQAHAFPIREMGYHHVVNDWIAGTPIVATY